jgi:hypothetical protein
MSFSAFSSFIHKVVFNNSKNKLKNLPFLSTFNFSAEKEKKHSFIQTPVSKRGCYYRLARKRWPYITTVLLLNCHPVRW